MNVFIHTNPFSEYPQHYPSINIDLPVPTNATNELLKYAMKALRLAFKKGYKYQKAGVVVMDLVPEEVVQSSLFDKRNRKRDSKLHHVIDSVNGYFGRDKIRFSVQGYSEKWRLKAEKLSRRFTTRIEDVLCVKI